MATNNRKQNVRNAAATEKADRWHNISGLMMVFGEEKETRRGEKFIAYNTSVGKKDDNGEWDNAYINVSFTRENDPGVEGGFLVDVKAGFITFDTWRTKTGKTRKALRIVITDYTFPE